MNLCRRIGKKSVPCFTVGQLFGYYPELGYLLLVFLTDIFGQRTPEHFVDITGVRMAGGLLDL